MNRVKYIIVLLLIIICYPSKSETKLARSNDYINVKALTESAKRVRANANSSLSYLSHAGKIALKSDDSLAKILYYLNIGEYWKNSGKLTKSIDYLINALRIAEQMSYKKETALALTYIGEFHRANTEFNLALEKLKKAETIAIELNDKEALAIIYDRLAAVHFEIEILKIKKNVNSLNYANKSLSLALSANDTVTQISCYNLLGAIACTNLDFSKSLNYFQLGLNLANIYKDSLNMCLLYINIARSYYLNCEYQKCIEYAKKAYELSKNQNILIYTQFSAGQLAGAYEKIKDYKTSLIYQHISSEADKAMFIQDKENKMYEIQRKYDSEKKQAELDIKESQLINIILFAIIIIAVFAFWGGVAFIKNRKLKTLNSGLKESRKVISLQNQELSELNMTKDKFFSIIAHDIKNPVFAFTQGAEILYNHFEDFSDAEKKDIICELKDSSINLSNLLENLLTWSRSQRNILEFLPCQFDLQYTCNSLIDLLSTQAKAKNVSVVSKIDNPILITADVNMINTIIRNLLSNAIKFSQIGGTIELFHELNDSYIKISVKDNGVGMTEETCTKIFDLEKNTSERGTVGEKGTGLGLILCKEFVNKHNGRIWVESKIGKGSTFKFEIPQI